jgi:hypothetical protein
MPQGCLLPLGCSRSMPKPWMIFCLSARSAPAQTLGIPLQAVACYGSHLGFCASLDALGVPRGSPRNLPTLGGIPQGRWIVRTSWLRPPRGKWSPLVIGTSCCASFAMGMRQAGGRERRMGDRMTERRRSASGSPVRTLRPSQRQRRGLSSRIDRLSRRYLTASSDACRGSG